MTTPALTGIQSGTQETKKPPHEIQIDMGEELNVCGFMQMPRQDKMPNGIITQYEFYVSNDPKNWGSPATKGSFKNNKKNRSMQLIYFKGSDQSKTSYKGRYIRLILQRKVLKICLLHQSLN